MRSTLALLVTASGPYTGAVTAQGPRSTLPSPEQFFGFQMGADRKIANWDKLHEYYLALARASNRIKLVELGKSSEGRAIAVRCSPRAQASSSTSNSRPLNQAKPV